MLLVHAKPSLHILRASILIFSFPSSPARKYGRFFSGIELDDFVPIDLSGFETEVLNKLHRESIYSSGPDLLMVWTMHERMLTHQMVQLQIKVWISGNLLPKDLTAANAIDVSV